PWGRAAAGGGQTGAGIMRAPLACLEPAVPALQGTGGAPRPGGRPPAGKGRPPAPGRPAPPVSTTLPGGRWTGPRGCGILFRQTVVGVAQERPRAKDSHGNNPAATSREVDRVVLVGPDLLELFVRELELCRVERGENIVILAEPRSYPEYIAASFSAARVLGANPLCLTLPGGSPATTPT